MGTLGDQLRSNFMNMTPEEIRRDQLIRIRRENPWPDVDPQIRRPAPPPNIGPDPYDFPEQRVSFPESDAGPVGDTGPEGVAGSAGNDDLDMTSYNELLSNARAGRGLRDTARPTSPGTPSSYRPAMASRTPDSTADFSVRRSEPQLPEYSYGGQPKELPEMEVPSVDREAIVEPGPETGIPEGKYFDPGRSLRPGAYRHPGVSRVPESFSGRTDAGVGSQYAGKSLYEEQMLRADPRNHDPDDPTATADAKRVMNDPEAQRMAEHAKWNGIKVPGVGGFYMPPSSHFRNSGSDNRGASAAAERNVKLSEEAAMLRLKNQSRTTTPTAPEKGLVGYGARAKFYAGRDEQPETLGGRLAGVEAGEALRSKMPDGDSGREITLDPSRVMTPGATREGDMARRARAMRGTAGKPNPEYWRAVNSARSANADGPWYKAEGGPGALALDQVTTPYAPKPREWTPEEVAGIKKRQDARALEQADIKDNLKRKNLGPTADRPLTVRERAQMEAANAGIRSAADVAKIQADAERDKFKSGNEYADKKWIRDQAMAARSDMILANEEAMKAEAEARVSPGNVEVVERAATLRRIARSKEILFQQFNKQAGAPDVPTEAVPSVRPYARPDAIKRAALTSGGLYRQAKAYIQEVGVKMTPEEYEDGVRAFGQSNMSQARGFLYDSQYNPVQSGLKRVITWPLGW